MATSGSVSVTVTKWDTLKFSWSLASQSVANNTSTISWKMELIATGSGRISSTVSKDWSVTVNGTKYSGKNTVGISNNSTKTLASGTTTIAHNSNGTKTFDFSFSQDFDITFSGVKIGTKNGSGSGTLTTIPRASSLTAGNGTLGTAQTLTISRADSTFKHKITYSCGSASGYAAGSSSGFTTATSVSWTPPIGLASQNTTGTTVSVKLTLYTYTSDGTQIGTASKTVTMSMPSSVKPTCSIEVTDTTNITSTYGSPVKGLSKFKVTVTGTQAYGSAIASYKTTANGSTYTASSFTTDVLKSSGEITISSSVTDKRGRTGSASVKKTVLNYNPPVITKLYVSRCNASGSANDNGDHAKVSFTSSITSLSNKNSATYKLRYKKTSGNQYTEVTLTATDISNGYCVIPADTGNSYNIEFTVTDKHNSTSRTTTVSTAFVLMHWNTTGDGMGIGKVSELPEVLDVGMKTRHYGGLLYPILEAETDLDDVLVPNSYVGENVTNYNYGNCPLTSGTFTLEVLSMGDNGQVMQRLTQCNKTSYLVYERVYYTSAWGSWYGGWNYPTLDSNFTMYGTSTADNQARYRKDGRIVEIRGVVTPVSSIAVTDTTTYSIFTLPTGYRPSSPIQVLCQGSGACTWLLGIKTNGEVNFSRYRDGSGFTTASNNTWLPFQATFIVG